MSAGPLQYLKFGDVEVANAARTLSYLRRGLGGTENGHWELGASDAASVLYRVNGGTCVAPDAFVHPAVDPAPWYDPSEPGSTSFLGLVLLDITGYDSTIKRAVTQRMGGLGGGTLTAQYRKPREWGFRGAMISASDAGAEYGLRWLTSVLAAGHCDTCATNSMTVRLVAPPDDCSDDQLGEWICYESALMEGPYEKEPWGPARLRVDSDVLSGCRDWVTVEFTVVSGNPFRYKRPVVCLEQETLAACDQVDCTDICTFLSGAGTAPCCVVEPPERGIVGAIFTLTCLSTSDFGQVQMSTRAECTDLVPLSTLTLSSVPAGSTVVVDCSRHTIVEVDALGNTTDAQHLVQLASGQTIEWIEVATCDQAACVCVSGVGDVPGTELAVQIATQLRED